MTGLIHERASVKFPGATPASAFVVFLWAGPEDVYGHRVELAETTLLHRTFQKLQSGITPILFHDKEANASLIACLDHGEAVFPASRHRLFRHDVETRPGYLDRLTGMQSARGRQNDAICVGRLEQERQGAMTGRAGTLDRRCERRRIRVANIREFAALGMLFK